MEIFKAFKFDSAHRLTGVGDSHPCSKIHGHTYTVTLHFTGEPDQRGMVVDFHDIKKVVKPLVDTLDHNTLNDVPGLENPTSENIAVWFWDKVKPVLPLLSKVVINESESSGVCFTGR